MTRKAQITGANKGNIQAQNQFIARLFGLGAQAKNTRFV